MNKEQMNECEKAFISWWNVNDSLLPIDIDKAWLRMTFYMAWNLQQAKIDELQRRLDEIKFNQTFNL
jgi:hypothetical protein